MAATDTELARGAAMRAKWPRILALIAEGSSLRAICKREDMPSRELVRRWLAEDREAGGELIAQYARARQWQGEDAADEVITIADAADPDSPAAVNKARLQVDTRKWIASKLYPRVYGDRIDVGVSGSITSHLEVGGMLAHAITGGSAAGAVTPQTLGTARVTVDDERVDDDTHDVDTGEDEGAHGGREADAGDVLDPAT